MLPGGYMRGRSMTEGWQKPWNARKWHYFVDGESLCGRWLLLGWKEWLTGNDDSPDNCKKCRERLKKR